MAKKQPTPRMRAHFGTAQQKLFPAGTKFFDSSGRVQRQFVGMSLYEKSRTLKTESGKPMLFRDKRPMELSNSMKGEKGTVFSRKTGTVTTVARSKWETFGTKNGTPTKPMTLKQMVMQLSIAAHQLPISVANWRNIVALRSLAIFQGSFTMKAFNSANKRRWKKNTKWTIAKRIRKRTWLGDGGLMQETGALRRSLKLENRGAFVTSITSDCPYGGYHNSPDSSDTYGDGFNGKFSPPKPITKRQFMGHSTLIMEFIEKYQDKYLLDMVFRRLG